MPRLSTTSPTARLLWAILTLTLVTLGVTAPPAQAATTFTTTGSCVDGGGMTWHTKVIWGSTYRSSTGQSKVSVDYAGWTSTLGRLRTDSIVRSYDGTGRLVRALKRTAAVDYRLGTVYAARNPVNPPSGGARIVITVGRDGDGFANCSVTHSQSATADPVIAAVGDLACAPTSPVTPTTCQHVAVSDSIVAAAPAAFFTLGDNQYQAGTLAEYKSVYGPSYGRLKTITRPRAAAAEALESGEAELAIGYFPDLRTAGFYQQKLFDNPHVCLVRRDHPTIGDTLTLDAYLAASHAIVRPDGRQHVHETFLQQRGLRPRVLLELSHFMSLIEVLETSDLIATVPLDVAQACCRHGRLRAVEVPLESPVIPVYQFWHGLFHKDAANQWLRGVVYDTFAQGTRRAAA